MAGGQKIKNYSLESSESGPTLGITLGTVRVVSHHHLGTYFMKRNGSALQNHVLIEKFLMIFDSRQPPAKLGGGLVFEQNLVLGRKISQKIFTGSQRFWKLPRGTPTDTQWFSGV